MATWGCAAPPPDAFVDPDGPDEELAILDWGGGVWGGWRAPNVTSIDGQPVASQLVGSSAKITAGEHSIGFEYSIYRGPFAMPAHRYVQRTLTFEAEAGHVYHVYTDCGTLGSTACASWIEDISAGIAVAGTLPSWADRDLVMQSVDAAKVHRRSALFEDQLSSVCAGDRRPSDVALYFLAGLTPLDEQNLVTAYGWYHLAASRGDEEASAIAAAIERELSPEQSRQAAEAVVQPLGTLCPDGTQNEPDAVHPRDGTEEDM